MAMTTASSTTTTGPWRQWRKRGRSQRAPEVIQLSSDRTSVHLSTALAILLLLGVLVSLNFNIAQGHSSNVAPHYSESADLYGFPLPWLKVKGSAWYAEADRVTIVTSESHFTIHWAMALGNVAVLCAAVAALAWLLERRFERKTMP